MDKIDINFDILVYTFYSLLPYLIIGNTNTTLLLWVIPNTIISIIVFTFYISKIKYPKHLSPTYSINIINGRYHINRLISNCIETCIIGLIISIIYSIIPQLSHPLNCIVVADIIYAKYDMRRRLTIYYNNLLPILLYGIPLTLLQMYINDTFILNYLYYVILIIQTQWLMQYI